MDKDKKYLYPGPDLLKHNQREALKLYCPM